MKKSFLKIGILIFISVFGFFVLNYNDSFCNVSAHENQNNIILHQENDDSESNDAVNVCDYPPVIDDNTPSGNTPLSEGEGETETETCNYPPVIDDNTPSGNTPLSEGEGETETCNYPPVIDDNTPSGNTPLSEGEGETETCDYPPVIDDNTPSGNTPLKLDINEQKS